MANQHQSLELKRTLKLRHILILGLAYMSPWAVFDTFGIISELTNGHVPASYVLVIIAVLFTVLATVKWQEFTLLQVQPIRTHEKQ